MFGQLVIGAPGSGKTTYCKGICEFLNAIGRETVIVNLDPGNDTLPYTCCVDVMELISLQDVMQDMQLGPNGGLIYCMEYLEENMDWLKQKIDTCCKGKYLLFDCPGQIELFTHHRSMRNIVNTFVEKWDIKVCCVQLVDSHHCSDTSKFISAALVSLSTMMMMELPHVNVLSKVDLVQQYGPLAYNFDFYTQLSELARLPKLMELRQGEGALEAAGPYAKLNTALAQMIDDFSLVNFAPLSISDKETVAYVVRLVDKSNGYLYVAEEEGKGQVGEIDEVDVLDLVELRYLHDPENPYQDSSSDEEVPGGDVAELAEALHVS